MSEKRELTRAELVRARRARRNIQQIAQVTQHVVKPFTKVTSRVGTPYVQTMHKRNESHRRFNVALGLPQFALRKPAIRAAGGRGGWRLVSFVLSVVFGAAVYFAWTLPYFKVSAATVFGNARLSGDEINAVLGVAGRSIFMVQPEETAARLRLNYPELAAAEVNVYLPNLVYVNVSERQPIILWLQGEGITWIDATGVAFRPRGQVNGLVTVIGLGTPPAGSPDLDDPLNPPRYVQKELVEAILVLAPNVPAGSTLTYDPNDGLGWKDSRGWNVYFGTDSRNMPLKLRVYQSLVESLAGREMFPEYINVVYPEAPFYRMTEFSGIDSSFESGQ